MNKFLLQYMYFCFGSEELQLTSVFWNICLLVKLPQCMSKSGILEESTMENHTRSMQQHVCLNLSIKACISNLTPL